MKNKRIWIVLLILGIVPFIFCLFYGIYNSIVGFSGLSFYNRYYGTKAFFDSIILLSYLIFPFYIIGLLLIILSIIKLRRKK